MLVSGEAQPVAREIPVAAPGGQRRGRPEGAGLLVLDVDGFSGRIANRIVAPGRETVVVAVPGPREARSGFGAGEPECLVRHDVRPGRGGCGAVEAADAEDV